jgi:hypothetical protein
MLKTLTLVLGLAAFAGCKTDAPESSSSSEKPSTTATPSGPKPRSGKIDLPTLPANPNGTSSPELPPRTEGERDAVSQQAREERRQQRRAELDTNGDGEISEEERQAARAKREQEMKDRLDTNKDGVVSDEERGAARQARAEDMHARLDRDGDGKVTTAELAAGRFGRMGGDMTAADANADGQVTVEELDSMMKNRPERGPFRRGMRRGGGAGSAPSE